MLQKTLKEKFDYDAINGTLIRKNGFYNCNKPHHSGYFYLRVNQKKMALHRLIYIWHHGDFDQKLDIDHIDRDKGNNKIENLRLVTHSGNMWNKNKGKNNKTGLTGVCAPKRRKNYTNKYHAQIGSGKKTISIGYYFCPIIAHLAYRIEKKKLHNYDTLRSEIA